MQRVRERERRWETGTDLKLEILIRPAGWPYIQPVLMQLESTVVGSTCEYTIRAGSGGCWRRWRRAASRRPSWWSRPGGQPDRYVVIDGYKRIRELQQLGRDKVEAVVWPMNEAEAIVLDRSLRLSEHETALEVGWLLAELEQRSGRNTSS